MTALTLLQHAGATAKPIDLAKSVLVIIDAQNEYLDGKLPLSGVAKAVGEIGRLLDAARDSGMPVFHIVHHSAARAALFAAGSHAAEIIPALAPIAGETVIAKTLPNAFAGTTLAAALTDLAEAGGRTDIILVGFMTHMCLSATARAALDLGIRAIVVASAAATRDLPDPLGGVINADIVHRTALAELADRFATVVPDIQAVFPVTKAVAKGGAKV
ncbi:nicotinamidase-like amidase [Rhizobium leguminosarum bv. trifolii WSM2297]|uniref:Nicotinamidase-like amidase n=1 Tax=Rhizobium leguminosarum bv. trifolii WSM2297 TaxID=754762 RepID=J0W003_RHILT|nr:cysteine hydrolase family protein [Rhizobium leguminosarum]EJC78438.1 nicotinamidase-like amidase [Rhizobium leguminosarum bv. trifolii WSM2297]